MSSFDLGHYCRIVQCGSEVQISVTSSVGLFNSTQHVAWKNANYKRIHNRTLNSQKGQKLLLAVVQLTH